MVLGIISRTKSSVMVPEWMGFDLLSFCLTINFVKGEREGHHIKTSRWKERALDWIYAYLSSIFDTHPFTHNHSILQRDTPCINTHKYTDKQQQHRNYRICDKTEEETVMDTNDEDNNSLTFSRSLVERVNKHASEVPFISPSRST